MKVLAVIFVIGLIIGFTTDDSDGKPQAPQMRPEMIVKIDTRYTAYACFTPDLTIEMAGHITNAETTKANAMLSNFQCFILPTTETFKILSVRGDGLVEFVNKTSDMSEGLWTWGDTFVPVRGAK